MSSSGLSFDFHDLGSSFQGGSYHYTIKPPVLELLLTYQMHMKTSSNRIVVLDDVCMFFLNMHPRSICYQNEPNYYLYVEKIKYVFTTQYSTTTAGPCIILKLQYQSLVWLYRVNFQNHTNCGIQGMRELRKLKSKSQSLQILSF